MRKYFLILLLLVSAAGFSQTTPNIIYGKEVVIQTRDTSSAELTIKNSTRNVLGYFKNIGGGKGQYVIIPQTDITGLPDSLLARYTKSQADARFKSISYIPSWLELTDVPSNFSTTYALSNDIQDSLLNKVSRNGSYANPSWITSLDYSKLTGTVPTFNQNTTGTASNVTGIVAIANGGTGSATQNFVDLTTTQSIGGAKTFTSALVGNSTITGVGIVSTRNSGSQIPAFFPQMTTSALNDSSVVFLGRSATNTYNLWDMTMYQRAANASTGGLSLNLFSTGSKFQIQSWELSGVSINRPLTVNGTISGTSLSMSGAGAFGSDITVNGRTSSANFRATDSIVIGGTLTDVGYAIKAKSATPYGAVIETTEATPTNNAILLLKSNTGSGLSTTSSFTNTGRLGVGTATPSTNLHVVGGGLFTSSVQFGTTLGYTTATQGQFFSKGGGEIFVANLLAGAGDLRAFTIQRNDVKKFSIGLNVSDNLSFLNSGDVSVANISSTGAGTFSSSVISSNAGGFISKFTTTEGSASWRMSNDYYGGTGGFSIDREVTQGSNSWTTILGFDFTGAAVFNNSVQSLGLTSNISNTNGTMATFGTDNNASTRIAFKSTAAGGSDNYSIDHTIVHGGSGGYRISHNVTSRWIQMIAGSGGVQLSGAATSWSSISDSTMKKNIVPISNALQKAISIGGYYFDYKTDSLNTSHRTGVLAQQVNSVFPQAVEWNFNEEENRNIASVRYTELIPLLFAAIKELELKIKILENK